MKELVDRQWIARWVRLKLSYVDSAIVPHLRGHRVGRRVLFEKADVYAWFESGETKATISVDEFYRKYCGGQSRVSTHG